LFKNINFLSLLTFLVLYPLHNGYAANDVSGLVEKPVRKSIEIRQETQNTRTTWQEERQRLMEQYEQLQQTRHQLEIQREGLTKNISSVKERINEKEQQLADIEQISDQIIPFLSELLQSLHQQFQDDMPFLSIERGERLSKLDHLIMDPETPINEKFRKIMEALMVEAEYGQTIEVYQETVTVEGNAMLINVFRLGRIAIFYQSLDGKGCGFYNVATAKWEPLPAKYNHSIQTAMDIGAKRRPIELLSLPIGRMDVK
jgi:hypothetical protein